MQVDKLFAVIDRKFDAFDFNLKKVVGKQTRNEYYAVSVICIINGKTFTKKVLTIGCPEKAIRSLADAMLEESNKTKEVAPGLYLSVDQKDQFLKNLERKTSKTISGLTFAGTLEEVDEDDYDPFEDDDCCNCDWSDGDDLDFDEDDDGYDDEDNDKYDDECDNEDFDEYDDGEPIGFKITLVKHQDAPTETPTNTVPTGTNNAHKCPYCGAVVAPNFAFCPKCGGQQ